MTLLEPVDHIFGHVIKCFVVVKVTVERGDATIVEEHHLSPLYLLVHIPLASVVSKIDVESPHITRRSHRTDPHGAVGYLDGLVHGLLTCELDMSIAFPTGDSNVDHTPTLGKQLNNVLLCHVVGKAANEYGVAARRLDVSFRLVFERGRGDEGYGAVDVDPIVFEVVRGNDGASQGVPRGDGGVTPHPRFKLVIVAIVGVVDRWGVRPIGAKLTLVLVGLSVPLVAVGTCCLHVFFKLLQVIFVKTCHCSKTKVVGKGFDERKVIV